MQPEPILQTLDDDRLLLTLVAQNTLSVGGESISFFSQPSTNYAS